MSTAGTTRICASCARHGRFITLNRGGNGTGLIGSSASRPIAGPSKQARRSWSSSSSNTSGQGSSPDFKNPRPHQFRFIPLSLFALPPFLWYLYQDFSTPAITPTAYTDHTVKSSRKVSSDHAEVTVSLSPSSSKSFANPSTTLRKSGHDAEEISAGSEEAITIHHVMVKNPSLMIERPYTPVNDVLVDGEAKLIVKRVKGGEVGRLVHSLLPGDKLGLRGPIPTLTITPRSFDKVIMISSGTGIAPFLQLLAKTSPQPADTPGGKQTKFHLIHCQPTGERQDWVSDASLLPTMQAKHKKFLVVSRTPPGLITKEHLFEATSHLRDERIIVLVCLPPTLLRSVCGPLTPTLEQGELSGLLKDLGLRSDQVWKLE